MSYAYVEKMYNLHLRVGQTVWTEAGLRQGKLCRNKRNDQYVYVMFPGLKHSLRFHPKAILYTDPYPEVVNAGVANLPERV